MDACQSIGTMICSEEPLLERAYCIKLIFMDQIMAKGVPGLRLALPQDLDVVRRCLPQGLR
jgi:hypothetical protein